MMLNKLIMNSVKESKKFVAGNVLYQWLGMVSNVCMIFCITNLIGQIHKGNLVMHTVLTTLIVALLSIVIRFICSVGSSRMSYLASKSVKRILRTKIYNKLLKFGTSYQSKVSTSEVVQLSVEGVDQLETYFGAYLPQLFYSLLAPLTLFVVLSTINVASAVVLLVCVPLIPIAIAAVMIIAKKLFSKYWGEYTSLGDSFLENLQGLNTLKIYQSDEYKNEEMNVHAEKFRKITMRVLSMQLNSITVMDIVAYGGAALGAIIALVQLRSGNIDLVGCLTIILLSADFFIPMRQLGSFFHVAMNGMAASDKIVKLLSLDEDEVGEGEIVSEDCSIVIDKLSFSYEEDREILHKVELEFPPNALSAIVGESGCGKSTIASILMGRSKGYSGSVQIGGLELNEISEDSLMKNVTYISNSSYLFQGTVRENLLIADPCASDERLWEVLRQTNLEEFLKGEKGLDTVLMQKAANLSGGQCQRLALARALLHDSAIYIFDEATSNIDVESENEIMAQVHNLAKTKTVIMISHRLMNGVGADRIYVLDSGNIVESGTHKELLDKKGTYKRFWDSQQELENYVKGGISDEK